MTIIERNYDFEPPTKEELELLDCEKLSESELEMIGYTSTEEFWQRYASS
tara:strand:- start:357 stop:506 length:150 start_codon:yes stop_codon:yes gene_type:complete